MADKEDPLCSLTYLAPIGDKAPRVAYVEWGVMDMAHIFYRGDGSVTVVPAEAALHVSRDDAEACAAIHAGDYAVVSGVMDVEKFKACENTW